MNEVDNGGFSLVELIIVIAIMAVLVALIAPNLTKYLGKSKQATDVKNTDEVKHQTMACISDAQGQDIVIIDGEDGVRAAEYVLQYNVTSNKVEASAGTNGESRFASLLTDVFSEADVKSSFNKNNDKIQIIISGHQSAGYKVNVNFIS